MRKVLLLFLAIPFSFAICHSQVTSSSPYNNVVPAILNTAGGSYDNPTSYYRFEWSLGELVLVQTLAPADSSIIVTHGVLQPCTDYSGYSPLTLLFEKGDYKLFPNPTDGKFEVDFFVRTPGMMSLQLISSTGQLLSSKTYHYDGCCRIDLFDISRYPDGIYFIVADLKPDLLRSGETQEVIRHSGFKVIKLNH